MFAVTKSQKLLTATRVPCSLPRMKSESNAALIADYAEDLVPPGQKILR
jgi:hypothetical protein